MEQSRPQFWPTRLMHLRDSKGNEGTARWEQKYGVWFCTQADRPFDFMVHRYSWTDARLPSLARAGIQFHW